MPRALLVAICLLAINRLVTLPKYEDQAINYHSLLAELSMPGCGNIQRFREFVVRTVLDLVRRVRVFDLLYNIMYVVPAMHPSSCQRTQRGRSDWITQNYTIGYD